MNHESKESIFKVLEIPLYQGREEDNDELIKAHRIWELYFDDDANELIKFIQEAYEGPKTKEYNPGKELIGSFSVGVEFTSKDGLVLDYEAQSESFIQTLPIKTEFSPKDIKIMLAIAYGSLLEAT